MRKGKKNNNNIKKSKLDLFVLNLAHSHFFFLFSTMLQRGGSCSQASTIVFGLDNKKRRKPSTAYKHKPTQSLTREHRAGVIHYRHKLQNVIETVLTAVQKMKNRHNGGRVKMADGTFPVACDAVRSLCLV